MQVLLQHAHFGSLHARLGLATLLLTAATPMGGAAAFRRLGLTQRLPEAWQERVKWMHRKAGACTWALSLGTMLLGLNSKVVPFAVGSLLQMATLLLATLLLYLDRAHTAVNRAPPNGLDAGKMV